MICHCDVERSDDEAISSNLTYYQFQKIASPIRARNDMVEMETT